jgi:hypothetical protein
MLFNAKFMAESKKLDTELDNSVDGQDIGIKVKIKMRGNKRQSLTKTIATIEANYPMVKADIIFYFGKLTDINNNLVDLDSQITSYMLTEEVWDNDDYEKQSALCERYGDKWRQMMDKLTNSLDSLKNPVAIPGSSISGAVALPKLKLPQVELPKFDGQPETFERFMESFEKILGKFALTQFEKYTYLLQQVSGPAKLIVSSVPAGDLNYDEAKVLLTEAFSNVTVQQYSIIDKLTKLKLQSTKTAYQWISEARVLVEQVSRLNIDAKLFCQYFLWSGMSEKFKSQFIHIVNNSKPTLDEIIKNSFEVFNRLKDNPSQGESWEKSESKGAAKPNSVSMATNVNYDSKKGNYNNKKGCGLCHSINHPNAETHKFTSCFRFNTPEKKLEKIKELNGCIKCGLLNHIAANCRFSFKGKCSNCNKYHNYYLCVNKRESAGSSGNWRKDTGNQPVNKNANSKFSEKKTDSKPTTVSEPPIKNTEANVIDYTVMHVNENCMKNEMLIPTLTLSLPSVKKKKGFDARCMYDPASQTTFITRAATKTLKYKIIQKDITIQITGFNDAKIYTTDIIEFTVALRDRLGKVRAVVVPHIKSKIKSSNFPSIVKEFKRQNIPLADKHLTSENDDGGVDILLGVDFAHILPVHACGFGSEDKMSLMYYTSKGIMLAGDMAILKDSLVRLERIKDYISKIDSLI